MKYLLKRMMFKHVIDDTMSISTGHLSYGEIHDGWEDVVWDIDRWENDGGRSL